MIQHLVGAILLEPVDPLVDDVLEVLKPRLIGSGDRVHAAGGVQVLIDLRTLGELRLELILLHAPPQPPLLLV